MRTIPLYFISLFVQRVTPLVCILLLASMEAFSQKPKITLFDKSNSRERGKYVQDFMLWRSGRTYLATRNFSFELRSLTTRQAYIQFEPNASPVIGVGGYYRRLGLEIGFKVPSSEARLSKYGRTRTLDWSTSFYGDQFGGDGFLQRYSGFYVRNGYEANAQWKSGDPHPRYSDLTAFNLGGNLYYVFNHNRFSYRAAFTQTEQQVKSAGSFLLMGSASLMDFSNKGKSFIPPGRLPGYGFNDFRYGRFYNLALSPGYGYTFVRDQLYASVSLFMGIGVQHQRYTLDSTVYNGPRIFRKNNLRIAAGYFGETFYTGAGLLLDNNSLRVKNLVLSANANSLKIFVGYRF